MSNEAFYTTEKHLPKLEILTENERLFLSWENIIRLRASSDCLVITFMSEFGHIQISGAEPLDELLEAFQTESLRMIDGTKLNCKITKAEPES